MASNRSCLKKWQISGTNLCLWCPPYDRAVRYRHMASPLGLSLLLSYVQVLSSLPQDTQVRIYVRLQAVDCWITMSYVRWKSLCFKDGAINDFMIFLESKHFALNNQTFSSGGRKMQWSHSSGILRDVKQKSFFSITDWVTGSSPTELS